MSRREDINFQRRARERNRYARFTPEQRQHKIQNVLLNRKRKRNGSNTVVNCNVGCLFPYGAIEQPLPSCSLPDNNRPSVVTGQSSFQPHLSQLHELRAVSPCGFCHAKKFQYESPSFCCYNGQVVLANEDVPEALRTLFTSQTEEGLEFRKHIRAYNSMFAFTSFGVKLDKDLATSKQGVYTFRAQGQVYHDLPSLIPSGDRPSYFQLYFYDTDNELQNRLNVLNEAPLNKCVVKKLMEVLSGNPYSQVLWKLQHAPLDSYQIRIRSDVKLDQRVYNSPSADQVAAIWIEGNNPSVAHDRDIIVHSTSGHRHRVRHFFGCYDSLQYLILLPRGEVGWHQNIWKKKGPPVANDDANLGTTQRTQVFTSSDDIFRQEPPTVKDGGRYRVSCRQYYCYKLQI